ncbi:hypothetical protein Rsub_13375 [Raphidocelis subcapitata]|uniref:Methyltransferase n=1 Tax=Raphidocelis subcapitata TaxID=307507 RepID=A0A2V0PLU5_9CHLO|nr:hypothetical protein Rsub_13375 [Raphidocelis subcapitata]|eukprot:GBG00530.1 hypothetical protein Rsub_13375 [Raphidocelis subcapitata]
MQRALAAIAAALPDRGARVAELYAGAGAIGLSLAAAGRAAAVRCVEIDPGCREPFEAARAALPEDVAARVSLVIASAGDDPAAWLEGADTVIVDPPRKGLDPASFQELLKPLPAGSGSGSGGSSGGGGRRSIAVK